MTGNRKTDLDAARGISRAVRQALNGTLMVDVAADREFERLLGRLGSQPSANKGQTA